MENTLIGHGAEATITHNTSNKSVLKTRNSKSYRNPTLDERLITTRTKREAKILEKVHNLGINTPEIHRKTKNTLEMEFIDGTKLRDYLTNTNYKTIAKQLGIMLAILHTHDIIHGDLTTSNFIYAKKLYIIDFGLSFISSRIEDKAVDLHVLKEALKSYHHEFAEVLFEEILQSYKQANKDSEKVLERLAIVEKRGKNKQ
ncbi:MAG: KEOPS complex kinase/ATPase Bud32 [Candidatus Woesearchaeota archaeon]